jgi:hypothetical protein
MQHPVSPSHFPKRSGCQAIEDAFVISQELAICTKRSPVADRPRCLFLSGEEVQARGKVGQTLSFAS